MMIAMNAFIPHFLTKINTKTKQSSQIFSLYHLLDDTNRLQDTLNMSMQEGCSKETIMKRTLAKIMATMCSLLCICSIASPAANASPQTEVSDMQEASQVSPRNQDPPGLPWQVTDISNGGSYTFSGDTLGGVLYTLTRVKGKTSYTVKFTQISLPIRVTVYKYDMFGTDPVVATYTFTSSGAIMSFGASKTSDEFYLEFVGVNDKDHCQVSGRIY